MRTFLLAALAIAVVAAGCGKTLRPGYCRTDNDCGGRHCDNATDGGSFMCSDAGAPDGPDGGDAGDRCAVPLPNVLRVHWP